MNIYKILINGLLLIILPMSIFAQRTIKGSVKDATTNEPLPFVSVSLKGTTIGTTTNMDGDYVLKLNESVTSGSIEISCVGYKPYGRELSAIGANGIANIPLTASISEINEVAISAKSMFPQNVMRKAIGNINTNYAKGAFNYDLEYSDENTVDKTKRTRSAWVQLFDMNGYNRSSAYDNYKSINYQIVSVKTNFTPRTIADYSTNIDELLMFDIVRQSGNILDGARLGDFEISVEGSSVFKGDSVWMIHYSCNNPGLLTSGDWNASAASGSLLIGKKDYAVMKHTAEIKTKHRNEVSQALATDTAASATTLKEVIYTIETTYEKRNGVYFLKLVKYNCPAEKRSSSLEVVSAKTTGVIPIVGRDFLAKASGNKNK